MKVRADRPTGPPPTTIARCLFCVVGGVDEDEDDRLVL